MSDNLTSTIGKALLAQCPKYYEDSIIFCAYLQAIGTELDVISSGISLVLDSFFVSSAPDWALDTWEKELNISSYDDKPIDQRRSAIISKLRGVGTATASLLESVVESFGIGNVVVVDRAYSYAFDTDRDTTIDDYTVEVIFIDVRGIPANMDDCQRAIANIIPAHLAVLYIYNYLVWATLEAQSLTWDQLDAKGLSWDEFETGKWVEEG